MKTMKCAQLGGPATCTVEFHANDWEDLKNQSMNHGKEMAQQKDAAHIEAMAIMMEIGKDEAKMNAWMDEKKKEFDALPQDE